MAKFISRVQLIRHDDALGFKVGVARTMADLHLSLSTEERDFLAELLEMIRKDMLIEEHRTRTPLYREYVVHREDLINALLSKLGRMPRS
jgi:hypothetical protein